MHEVARRYLEALDEVDRHMQAIAPDQWRNPTPCTEWDLRALVDHVVYETLWLPDLVAGKTLAEVGDRYEGERLGDDPLGAWNAARSAAVDGISGSSLDVPVHTSAGETTADDYLAEMLFDASIHGWDVARAIGIDHLIPDDVARDLTAWLAPQVEEWIAAGIVAPPIEVGDDVDPPTRLIALTGRNPQWPGVGQSGP